MEFIVSRKIGVVGDVGEVEGIVLCLVFVGKGRFSDSLGNFVGDWKFRICLRGVFKEIVG